MKKQTVNRILLSVDEQFQRLGFKNWDDGMEFTVAVLSKIVDLLRDRPSLEKLFSDQPEPNADELAEMLQTIEQMLHFFRKGTLEFAKKQIPHDPGGRNSVLGTPSEQKQRCEQVLALIGKKVKTTDALKRVAQREGISLSSMYRIWSARGETNCQS